MFKKTLIMSVAAAGLVCGVAFAANGAAPTGTQIGVTFGSDLSMVGGADDSLLNNVQVALSMFNWDNNFALQAGFGVNLPDSDATVTGPNDNTLDVSDTTYDIALSALKLFPVSDTNYMTAGLGVEYSNEQSYGADDQPTNLTFALAGGFMHRMDSLNSVFAVTIPVFQSDTYTDDAGDSTTDMSLFAGANVSWTYFFK